MKIRSDYVSNSSSSSFIVSLPKTYEFKKFIDYVSDSCVEKSEYNEDKEEVERIREMNHRNLDYCLNTYRKLFLGELSLGKYKRTISGKEDCKMFMDYYNRVKTFPNYDVEEILSQKEDEIVVQYDNWINGQPISWDKMSSLCWVYNGREKNETDEERKEIVKKIVNYSRDVASGKFDDWDNLGHDYIELYEITLDTILNTEDLLKEGYTIKFDKWEQDLDALKTRIKNGERLFYITCNQGGEGTSIGSIYGLGGWDTNFNSKANVETLTCEPG